MVITVAFSVPQMADARIKDDAKRLIDQLPDEATWPDLQYEI